jgi:Trp operon repressor
MRCLACDVILSKYEATRKYEWDEFVDLCNNCYEASDLSNILDRQDLLGVKDDDSEDGVS